MGFAQSIRFAVIGDYGYAGQAELDVSNLVKSWNPDFIITLGDNNYENGAATTIDQNIGQYYHDYISPYTGSFGTGDTINRFFPALGNHDWRAVNAQPYLDYFTLHGNERYYDFVKGTVHFFVVDSDSNEPDGRTGVSTQAQWLHDKLANSIAQWKLVYFHHAPYSSGTRHGSNVNLQWQFQTWGATAVLAGHEHNYERITINNFPYFVNGLGGRSLYAFGTPISGSQVRYNSDYGAMLVEANTDSIVFKFITRTGVTIDTYTLHSSTQITLDQGWNMVSLPRHVADSAVSTIFPSAVSQAFSYNGVTYEPHDSMQTRLGYWIKSDSSQSIQLFGTSVHRDTITVSQDWNLIGTIADPIDVNDIVQNPAGIVVSPFFGYKGMYRAADTLYPGKAYWVKVNQSGMLIMD